jgi:hypothetical protein
MLMPRKRPPHIEIWRDRHGKLRTYGRMARKAPRIPLPDFGTPEFWPAYSQMLAGQLEQPLGARRHSATPGSLGALIASYLKSQEYANLRNTTKIGYASRIEILRTEHGNRTVAGLSRERIENGIMRPYADRPGAALSLLKMLRILIRHAMALDERNPLKLLHDPSAGLKRPKIKEIRAWSDSETSAYEARWPLGTKQRTAYSLMLYAGAARVDVHRMTWRQAEGLGHSQQNRCRRRARAALRIAAGTCGGVA